MKKVIKIISQLHFKRITFFYLFVFLISACGKHENKSESIELIIDVTKQTLLFNNLVNLTNNSISENFLSDSLAFLILPIQVSCPSCRKKTIDSIVENYKMLGDDHFIIISAKAGRKTINGYFREQNKELPVIQNNLFLDTNNKAFENDLYYDKPTVYYTANKRVYKKVAAIPTTVREDLREFFSGKRRIEL